MLFILQLIGVLSSKPILFDVTYTDIILIEEEGTTYFLIESEFDKGLNWILVPPTTPNLKVIGTYEG